MYDLCSVGGQGRTEAVARRARHGIGPERGVVVAVAVDHALEGRALVVEPGERVALHDDEEKRKNAEKVAKKVRLGQILEFGAMA